MSVPDDWNGGYIALNEGAPVHTRLTTDVATGPRLDTPARLLVPEGDDRRSELLIPD